LPRPVAGAALVPRVPEIIPQLMRTLRDESMNASGLSRQLAQDLVLVAEVYRESNRPCYRPRYHSGPPINSIFPATVTSAIEYAGPADATPLAQTLALSDRLSKLRLLVDAVQVTSDDPFVVDGLGKAALACFEKLQDED
jgi:hypothetical protein